MLQGEKYATAQNFDVIEPIDGAVIFLNCLCLKWAMDDKMDHTQIFNPISLAATEIGELYGLVPFAPVRKIHQISRSNHNVQPFFLQKPWSVHWFYVIKFLQNKTKTLKRRKNGCILLVEIILRKLPKRNSRQWRKLIIIRSTTTLTVISIIKSKELHPNIWFVVLSYVAIMSSFHFCSYVLTKRFGRSST